jgi:hypothetical protein
MVLGPLLEIVFDLMVVVRSLPRMLLEIASEVIIFGLIVLVQPCNSLVGDSFSHLVELVPSPNSFVLE